MTLNEVPTTKNEIMRFLCDKCSLPEIVSKNYIDTISSRIGHHGLSHVIFMLRLLKSVPPELIGNLGYLILAILFHDSVYVPGSKTNEIDSFKYFVKRFDFKEDFYKGEYGYVKMLILESVNPAFDTANTSMEKDILLLHDLDYAVLGADWLNYLEYLMGIWVEYGRSFGMKQYIEGRLKFLDSILAKDSRPFYLEWFRNKFEGIAFDNVEKEIAILEDEVIIS